MRWPVIEENAAGGRAETAPTNGAAGIIPAIKYYSQDCHPSDPVKGIRDFLPVAAAVGTLCKKNARSQVQKLAVRWLVRRLCDGSGRFDGSAWWHQRTNEYR